MVAKLVRKVARSKHSTVIYDFFRKKQSFKKTDLVARPDDSL